MGWSRNMIYLNWFALKITKLRKNKINRENIMSETLKAVEAAARKLASTIAARDVVQRSLDGIIAEQERRAATKKASAEKSTTETPPVK